jgi:hypothetical protein
MNKCVKVWRYIGGKRPLGRPRHRWGDNIKMDFRERGWNGMDWSNRFMIGTRGGLL